jgi:hypothetical protein
MINFMASFHARQFTGKERRLREVMRPSGNIGGAIFMMRLPERIDGQVAQTTKDTSA